MSHPVGRGSRRAGRGAAPSSLAARRSSAPREAARPDRGGAPARPSRSARARSAAGPRRAGRRPTASFGRGAFFSGYHLRLGRDGSWRLYPVSAGGVADVEFGNSTAYGTETELASGQLALDSSAWHRLGLTARGYTVIAEIDGTVVARAAAQNSLSGQVGIVAPRWQTPEVD